MGHLQLNGFLLYPRNVCIDSKCLLDDRRAYGRQNMADFHSNFFVHIDDDMERLCAQELASLKVFFPIKYKIP